MYFYLEKGVRKGKEFMDKKTVNLSIEDGDILNFQIHRLVTNFYKDMLFMIEDLAENHDTALLKLQRHLPEEYAKYVDLADYLTEDEFSKLRSRVLSGGNGAIRNIEDQLKNFDIKIKNNKEKNGH